MAEIVLTAQNFEKEVLQSDIPVLVDFWASWCGPCRMLAPAVEEISQEYAEKIKVGKVNVDEQEALAIQYRITSIPAVFVFKDGKIAKTSIGLVPKAQLEEMLKEFL